MHTGESWIKSQLRLFNVRWKYTIYDVYKYIGVSVDNLIDRKSQIISKTFLRNVRIYIETLNVIIILKL